LQLRERQQRRALRLPVRFWRPGQEDKAVVGYSLNVSGAGMFVATRRPLPPNAVVEIEITPPEGAVRASARVRHAARYPGQFQAIFKSGMGVRFFEPEEPELASLAKKGQLLRDRGGRRLFHR